MNPVDPGIGTARPHMLERWEGRAVTNENGGGIGRVSPREEANRSTNGHIR